MDIILHAGMGKCGSSALQTHLSRNTTLSSKSNRYVYAALRPSGLLYGKGLCNKANQNAFGYISSSSTKTFLRSKSVQSKLRKQLAFLSRKGTIILSNEGWTAELQRWQNQSLFVPHKDKVDVIIYIRHPVMWLNSAWWQWGAWSGKPFEKWLKAHLSRVFWANHVQIWQSLPFVNNVIVRVLGDNIVQDFLSLFDIEYDSAKIQPFVNKSLPNGVLRLFQSHKELRPSAHSSQIDFITSKFLNLPGKSPWILKPDIIEHILSETSPHNKALLRLVDEETKDIILNDPLWWDKEAYSNYIATNPDPSKPTYQELEQIAIQALLYLNNSTKIQPKKSCMPSIFAHIRSFFS